MDEVVESSVILRLLWGSPYAVGISVLVVVLATVWFVLNSRKARNEADKVGFN